MLSVVRQQLRSGVTKTSHNSFVSKASGARTGFRYASSTPTPSTTDVAAKKAGEALKTASDATVKAAASVGKALGPLGQRLGGMLGSYRQPIVYNLSVGKELAKQVYVKEGLAPPKDFASVRAAYETLYSRAVSPAYWRELVSSGQIVRVLVLGVEAYGIFKIGEILGRRSLVGYNLKELKE